MGMVGQIASLGDDHLNDNYAMVTSHGAITREECRKRELASFIDLSPRRDPFGSVE